MVTATTKDFKVSAQKPLVFVDDNATYEAAIHLGHCRSWRGLASGKLVRAPEEDRKDENGRIVARGYKPELACHSVGPISGKLLNGLISAHNDYLKERKNPTIETYQGNSRMTRPRREATLNHALLVSDISETDALPADVAPGRRIEHLLERIASALERRGV